MQKKINSKNLSLIKKYELNFPGIKDCFLELITRIPFNEFLQSNEHNLEILYLNRKHIHENLYIRDEFIEIKLNPNQEIKLAEQYYLNLLINDNKNVINYIYPIDYIKKINDYQK